MVPTGGGGHDAYLDTVVLRYFMQGVLDPCIPPGERTPTLDPALARMWLAAVRLVLYAPDRHWQLWLSDVGRRELETFDKNHGWEGWTLSLFEDVDGRADAPPQEQIADRGQTYLEQLALSRRHAADMTHLAWAASTPWIDTFVTNDTKLRRRARRLAAELDDEDLQRLRVLDPLQAEQELAIQPGERPRRRSPAPGNPLADHQWWAVG